MDMFLSIIIKLTAGLIGIIIITRLLGKKELSQVTPMDFVYVLIVGGIIEESMYATDTKFYHVLFALAFWGLLIWVVETFTQKFDNFRTLIKGEDTVLIEDGKVNIYALRKSKLEMDQLRTLLRMQGIFTLQHVEHAVLETSGQISVLKKAREEPVTKMDMLDDYAKNVPSYLVVEQGDINVGNLKRLGKSEAWLKEQLEKEGYIPDELYYAEWNELDGFYVQEYDNKSDEVEAE